ncbi:excinuclease ABC subunit UvrB [Paracholeplasma manati]|uniref:excinuclease ABC subunit UvrB n=1 Tax=Paracholeplasma manati TaxID=591373 RepID=UPI0024080D3A|nr:excinuclease ABC subunit UvrB [Paracholeplasma manati]MDG0888521.1 excinuclease ABC subunit UvrB [Paracholeplasma manati]
MSKFTLVAPYKPMGDQIEAIEKLYQNFNNGMKQQVLRGATGTGKTFTISNLIEKMGKKTLVLAHNKTLAGQLYSELKAFFPENRVEYFISYYDYYQPEAYVVTSDTYIEKDASINDEIDEMRHSATASLLERDDVIVVASVSCIYGIGDPDDYKNSMIFLRVGQSIRRNALLGKLVELTYQRNDIDFHRGTFRVRGDIVEIIPSNQRENGVRIEFFGDEIDRIKRFDVLTGNAIESLDYVTIWPATHFMTNKEKLKESIRRIKNELQERILYFKENDKPLEAERIQMRTKYDLEMLEEMGVCPGVENYSRHIALKEAGETPSTLIDFFNKDFMLIIDESHVTVSQVRGMYNGDRSRKMTLVDYGFRLPSALDNRPLKFDEFENKLDHVIYLSATPGDYELSRNLPIIEQIIRPTYLIDPEIEVRKSFGQIDDLYAEIVKRVALNERVLVTTLTIKMSEDLTAYFKKLGMKVAYLHSEIKSLERIVILRDLRVGKYDVLIGINLLREGLDLPEVSLVAILDADKQGFLRSERSLIQTIGRAARNLNGKVIMYADAISESMEKAIQETNRRRAIQLAFNEKYGTKPVSIKKDIRDDISMKEDIDELPMKKRFTAKDLDKAIARIERDMKQAAKELNFELATELRDQLFELKAERGY